VTPISVGIPTRNRCRFLPRTIESFLAQDHPDLEIVISDNASTDDTEAICREYADREPRVRYSRNETNLGLAGNFNRAIELTRFPYVVIAGDDDLYEPGFLATLSARLDGDPDLALVACAVDLIDEDDRVVRHVDQSYLSEPLEDRRRNASYMLWNGYGNLMTGMFRREMLLRTQGFALPYKDYWDAMDLVFLFDVSLAGNVAWIPEVLIHKRRGGVSAQPVYRSFPALLATVAGIARDYLRRVGLADLPRKERRLLKASAVARVIYLGWGMRAELSRTLLVGWMSPEWRSRIGSAARGWRRDREKVK
jgi:glycosyltransferase involved in cell wall biosynthesis